ncbi:hypothetical protein EBZ38_01550, partial [bacterium]|nr:hypothetical protein [bacterium]NDD82955.1 hypothetical protein [bacterium]
ELVPVPVILLDPPAPPALKKLEWLFLPTEKLFTLSPENYDNYLTNMDELDKYIKQLQEGWNYYRKANEVP